MDHKIDFLDIPCVRCVLQRNMLKQKRCDPRTCEKLTVWIESTNVSTDVSTNVYTDVCMDRLNVKC